MIKITMFSSADKVAGQGVGSAYLELINLLRNQCSDKFEIEINRYGKSQISHYHTIDPLFYPCSQERRALSSEPCSALRGAPGRP